VSLKPNIISKLGVILAVILIVSLASTTFVLLIQPGYSTIISNNNNGSTTTTNKNPDVSKEVFVVDYANILIQKFDTDGKFITKWGSEGDGQGQFKIPHGIALDSSDSSIYVTDMTGRLCKVKRSLPCCNDQ
jgi:DNA-binding beta-propeller fold protein YncE